MHIRKSIVTNYGVSAEAWQLNGVTFKPEGNNVVATGNLSLWADLTALEAGKAIIDNCTFSYTFPMDAEILPELPPVMEMSYLLYTKIMESIMSDEEEPKETNLLSCNAGQIGFQDGELIQ